MLTAEYILGLLTERVLGETHKKFPVINIDPENFKKVDFESTQNTMKPPKKKPKRRKR